MIEDAHTVRLLATGETVHAKTYPGRHRRRAVPRRRDCRLEHVISSNEAFHLTELPKRILIQGGGYIAVEFAGIFNGLGSEVTLVYRGDNILRGFDDDVRAHLRAEMEKRGIKIITRQTVDDVEKVDHGLCVELSDHEIVLGRPGDVRDRPASERHRLRARSGRRDARRDRRHRRRSTFSQTSVPNIYAVGDVTNRINLTPVAIREGHAFADTVFGNKPTPVDHADVRDRGVLGAGSRRRRVSPKPQARVALAKVDIYKTIVPPDEGDARRPRHAAPS